MKKQVINTEDVLLKTSRNADGSIKNYYFRLGDGIVLVDRTIGEKWDSIDSVTVDEVKYTQRSDGQGGFINEDWSRMEVVGKSDFTVTMAKKTRRLEAATSYAKAKNESLKVEDLAPSVKAELEALLA